MSRTIKILLTFSVMVNVVLLGVIGGLVFHKQRHSPWTELKASLAPESQNLIARSLQKTQKEIKPAFEQSRKLRMEIKEILEAEAFDAQAFEKAMQGMYQAQGKIMMSKTEMIKELAATLPQEERAKLSGKVLRGFGGGPMPGHERPRRDAD